ncbi:MAG: hypothetical protein AAFN00_05090 [Cyanobacteria bacterium J06558_2]
MSDTNLISIPAPRFALYESVNLSWNGEHKTQIVARWYDLDDGCWSYKCKNMGDEQFYPESMIVSL